MIPLLPSADTQATGDPADHRRDGRHRAQILLVESIVATLAVGNDAEPLTHRVTP